jgi:hypothetical protein
MAVDMERFGGYGMGWGRKHLIWREDGEVVLDQD